MGAWQIENIFLIIGIANASDFRGRSKSWNGDRGNGG